MKKFIQKRSTSLFKTLIRDNSGQLQFSNYSQMIYPFLILLFFINGMFLFTMGMPANQEGTKTLQMGFDQNGASYTHLYATTTGFLNDTNILLKPPQGDYNVTSFSQSRNYPESQKNWIFGLGEIIGLFGTLMNYLINLVFGYWFWIDYFLWPGTILSLIAIPIKFFFFFIQMYGVLSVVLSIFGVGLGSRTL